MPMVALPKQYAWLANERAPKILLQMLALYGTLEKPGAADNPVILGWAKEVGLSKTYTHDSIAWCGLTMAVAAKRAGYEPVKDPLWARNWATWGLDVTVPMLGDVLVFNREYRDAQGNLRQAGHVGEYVGEDAGCYHVLAGNQGGWVGDKKVPGDAVSITRIAKSRLIAARRSPWKIGVPANVRRVWLKADGAPSVNEA